MPLLLTVLYPPNAPTYSWPEERTESLSFTDPRVKEKEKAKRERRMARTKKSCHLAGPGTKCIFSEPFPVCFCSVLHI